MPLTASKASSVAISMAADDERPLPKGTVLCSRPSKPARSAPSSLQHPGRAAHVVGPGHVAVVLDGVEAEVGRARQVERGDARHGGRHAAGPRSRCRGRRSWWPRSRRCSRCGCPSGRPGRVPGTRPSGGRRRAWRTRGSRASPRARSGSMAQPSSAMASRRASTLAMGMSLIMRCEGAISRPVPLRRQGRRAACARGLADLVGRAARAAPSGWRRRRRRPACRRTRACSHSWSMTSGWTGLSAVRPISTRSGTMCAMSPSECISTGRPRSTNGAKSRARRGLMRLAPGGRGEEQC